MFTQITRITQGLRLTDLPPPQAELTFTVPCHVWQHFPNADKCLLPEEHSAALFTLFHSLMFFHLWHLKLGFYSRVVTHKYILFRCNQCRLVFLFSGEICGFRVHNGPGGSGSAQFEAVVLDRSTGEGLVRSKEPLDCESQKEHSFTIQAYDCGEGSDGTNSKKSHK